MTRLDYELLSMDMPELKLPEWENLSDYEKQNLKLYTREKLIVQRSFVILTCEYVNSSCVAVAIAYES